MNLFILFNAFIHDYFYYHRRTQCNRKLRALHHPIRLRVLTVVRKLRPPLSSHQTESATSSQETESPPSSHQTESATSSQETESPPSSHQTENATSKQETESRPTLQQTDSTTMNKDMQLPQETESSTSQEAEKTLCYVQGLQDVHNSSVPDHFQLPNSTVGHVSLLDLIFVQLCTNMYFFKIGAFATLCVA